MSRPGSFMRSTALLLGLLFVASTAAGQAPDSATPAAEPAAPAPARVDAPPVPAPADARPAPAPAASPPAPAPAPQPATTTTAPVTPALGRFAEDGGAMEPWQFRFHGYVRMPLRFEGKLRRPPYLVDDDYFLSGFSYLRVQEREWAELFLEANYNEHTRVVVGLFASQFSDWSEVTLQGQGGIATAFVEHEQKLAPWLELDARVGMFWDRYGYVQPYDTYLHGRTHIAGGRLSLRAFDLVEARIGLGAHAEVIGNNQGFTPVLYGTLGVDTEVVDVSLFGARTWTRDSKREFAMNIRDATLRVFGLELLLDVARAGRLQYVLGFMDAEHVLSLANSLEILHSTGGRGLSQNFFGAEDDGTGQAIMSALDATLQPYRMLPGSSAARRYLDGLDVQLFGMYARVKSKTDSPNPLLDLHNRTYLKWGYQLSYRPLRTPAHRLFAALRYDRVIPQKRAEDMAFSVYTPRLGVVLVEGLDVFAAYSFYSYGKAVSLRPNQIPGDNGVTQPDERVFKLQAQARF
jgi:hypothetical protein